MRSKGKALDRHHSQSTPNLLAVEAEKEAEKEDVSPPKHNGPATPPKLEVSVSGARMDHLGEELVVYFDISVRVGVTELAGAKRRYREFRKLCKILQLQYPHLLHPDSPDEQAEVANSKVECKASPSVVGALPPLPGKHLFRAGWDPIVVVERVTQLGCWLGAVCERLQFASIELVHFLNVPLYAAIRMLSGDLQVCAHVMEQRGARACVEDGWRQPNANARDWRTWMAISP